MYSLEINLDSSEKSFGHVHFPLSDDRAASRRISVPVFFSGKKAGCNRCVLFLSGTHGNEYEGQILARRMPRIIENGGFGCEFIVFPSLNFPACDAATRLSPIDGKNMFRSYNESSESVTSRITSFLINEVVPRVDVVVDLHSGGPTLKFVPSVIVHTADESPLHEETMKLAAAMGPALLTIRRPRKEPVMNTLYGILQNERKILLTTELGGGSIEKKHVDTGLLALTSLLEALDEKSGLSGSSSVSSPPFLIDLGSNGEIFSPVDGIFEPLVKPGDKVSVGEEVGVVHRFANPWEQPVLVSSSVSGLIIAARSVYRVRDGDCLFQTGKLFQ